ncbi:MAG: PadR family transcriptional regulator, partial [Clostridia bacterium]
SESTLYPILKRLESVGNLYVYSAEHNSRLRKYYHLTDSGREKINKFVTQWDEIEKIYQFVKKSV